MVPSKGGKVDRPVDGQNASLPPKVKPWLGEGKAEAKATREYLRFEICDFIARAFPKQYHYVIEMRSLVFLMFFSKV